MKKLRNEDNNSDLAGKQLDFSILVGKPTGEDEGKLVSWLMLS